MKNYKPSTYNAAELCFCNTFNTKSNVLYVERRMHEKRWVYNITLW